ncbi:MAG: hypothetical protein MJY83_03550 [Bacteroidales bacterium]|nr:hypothetical protein [Bacteroidales bacterium]
MKKIFYTLLLLLPFCLTSCGGDEDELNPLVGKTFRCQMGSEYSQYTFFDGYLGTVCDFVLVSPGGNMQKNSISYSWDDKNKQVEVPSTSLYKDNSSSLLRPNDKFGSMYADTDPVSGTLKNDAGNDFGIFFN